MFEVIQDVVVLKYNLIFRSSFQSGEMFKASVCNAHRLFLLCKLCVLIKVPEKLYYCFVATNVNHTAIKRALKLL